MGAGVSVCLCVESRNEAEDESGLLVERGHENKPLAVSNISALQLHSSAGLVSETKSRNKGKSEKRAKKKRKMMMMMIIIITMIFNFDSRDNTWARKLSIAILSSSSSSSSVVYAN